MEVGRNTCGDRWQEEEQIQIKQKKKKNLILVERVQGEIIEAGVFLTHSSLGEPGSPDSLVISVLCAWLCQVIL